MASGHSVPPTTRATRRPGSTSTPVSAERRRSTVPASLRPREDLRRGHCSAGRRAGRRRRRHGRPGRPPRRSWGLATAAGRWSTATFQGIRAASYPGSPGRTTQPEAASRTAAAGWVTGWVMFMGCFLRGCEGGAARVATSWPGRSSRAVSRMRVCGRAPVAARRSSRREDVEHPEKGDPVGGEHLDVRQTRRRPAPERPAPPRGGSRPAPAGPRCRPRGGAGPDRRPGPEREHVVLGLRDRRGHDDDIARATIPSPSTRGVFPPSTFWDVATQTIWDVPMAPRPRYCWHDRRPDRRAGPG